MKIAKLFQNGNSQAVRLHLRQVALHSLPILRNGLKMTLPKALAIDHFDQVSRHYISGNMDRYFR